MQDINSGYPRKRFKAAHSLAETSKAVANFISSYISGGYVLDSHGSATIYHLTFVDFEKEVFRRIV